jgi:hypothetical protein
MTRNRLIVALILNTRAVPSWSVLRGGEDLFHCRLRKFDITHILILALVVILLLLDPRNPLE